MRTRRGDMSKSINARIAKFYRKSDTINLETEAGRKELQEDVTAIAKVSVIIQETVY